MALTPSEIKEILGILEASGWDEAQITIDDVTLTVSKSGNGLAGVLPDRAPAPTAAPVPASPQPTPHEEQASTAPGTGGQVVEAPSVGVFWRAPEPGAAPFVDVGDDVEAGATLCIVEVMKLMNHVQADVAGVVRDIHVSNGDHVEFGTPLFTLAPAAS
jgi:acetyl-CoA carboxylase biotin carboxyl carrier protein